VSILQRIHRSISGCDAAGHVPDRRRVRRKDGDFRTLCRHCQVKLVRYGTDDWRPESGEQA
jgi:predicted SprT family Zn-dependent metalloprotease